MDSQLQEEKQKNAFSCWGQECILRKFSKACACEKKKKKTPSGIFGRSVIELKHYNEPWALHVHTYNWPF